MSINPDQAIFDAIIAATKDQSLSCGQIVIDTQAFIKTFNGHRDRKLCTSLDVAQAAPDTLDHDITNILMSSADDSKRINQILDLMSRRSRGVAQAPSGLANLCAIVADQPFQNSALSVYEIDLILANTGSFMPDEAVMWFRASRGTFGVAQTPPDQFMDDYKRDTTNAMAARIKALEAALREIDNMAPATCEVTLAHQMADIASAALRKAMVP